MENVQSAEGFAELARPHAVSESLERPLQAPAASRSCGGAKTGDAAPAPAQTAALLLWLAALSGPACLEDILPLLPPELQSACWLEGGAQRLADFQCRQEQARRERAEAASSEQAAAAREHLATQAQRLKATLWAQQQQQQSSSQEAASALHSALSWDAEVAAVCCTPSCSPATPAPEPAESCSSVGSTTWA